MSKKGYVAVMNILIVVLFISGIVFTLGGFNALADNHNLNSHPAFMVGVFIPPAIFILIGIFCIKIRKKLL